MRRLCPTHVTMCAAVFGYAPIGECALLECFSFCRKEELPWGFPDKPKGNLLFTSHLISFVLSLMELSDLPASPPPSRKQLTKLTPQQGQLGPNQKKSALLAKGALCEIVMDTLKNVQNITPQLFRIPAFASFVPMLTHKLQTAKWCQKRLQS